MTNGLALKGSALFLSVLQAQKQFLSKPCWFADKDVTYQVEWIPLFRYFNFDQILAGTSSNPKPKDLKSFTPIFESEPSLQVVDI